MKRKRGRGAEAKGQKEMERRRKEWKSRKKLGRRGERETVVTVRFRR
jgi:hypothetical protein